MSAITIVGFVILLLAAAYFLFGHKNDPAAAENAAKRFAKLLIAEIKLYETYKVERGLKNNNLYESLADEIEEARKKYKKSFPNAEFERYFDETLVIVLANGDKAKLGQISLSGK